MTDPCRVLVVDDEPAVRDAYTGFLQAQDGVEVCGQAGDGQVAVSAFESLRPDVVLMDLGMPRVSGLMATEQICRRWPGACVVALTTFGDRESIVAALRAGAAGYLLKDCGGAALVAGIRQARDGEMPLSAPVRRQLVASVVREGVLPGRAHLTPRERELVNLLAQGLTNQQIGHRMHVSEGSVKQYLTNVGTKLRARSRTQVLIRAVQLNLVDPHGLPPLDG